MSTLRSSLCAICSVLVLLSEASVAYEDEAAPFGGGVSRWQGFERHDFRVDGRAATVVVPETAAPGHPWIWRARFFGHEPQLDVALLRRGYHVAYCDVGGLFGSPRAVAHWNAFHDLVTRRHGLATKVALEGMSRGGLIIYNWAAENPGKVACIYADAPVCDFKSWPGGRGRGKGSAGAWRACLAAYGLDEAEALEYERQPIDQLEPLARAKVPLLHVVGAADKVVPVEENTSIVERRYRELGGSIHVISKAGVGHHPHSLQQPRPLESFIVSSCRAAGADRSERREFEGNLRIRGGVGNSRRIFEETRKGHVAFMGGSITEMNGYRPLVGARLRQRFPRTEFTFTNAGISSTCSTTGAFRLGEDVLAKGAVDLFFVEFAVNDDQDAGHAARECVRAMEGIVRQIRRHNARADIVIVHFVNPGILASLHRGEAPLTVAAHERVAERYGVDSVLLAREVSDRILGGELTWKEYGGTHPKRPGNELCSRMVWTLLERAWARASNDEGAGGRVTPAPFDAGHYGHGRFLSVARAEIRGGWKRGVPNWKSIPGSKRGRFRDIEMLSATEVGSELTLGFRGALVGVYVVAGPDAGVLEGTIDGKAFESVDLYHRFSRGLHYPRTVILASGLPAGEHRLVLRLAESPREHGSAARIIRFAILDGR